MAEKTFFQFLALYGFPHVLASLEALSNLFNDLKPYPNFQKFDLKAHEFRQTFLKRLDSEHDGSHVAILSQVLRDV